MSPTGLFKITNCFTALEQLVRELSGASQERDVLVERGDKRPFRQYTGDRRVPAAVPAEPGRGSGAGTGIS